MTDPPSRRRRRRKFKLPKTTIMFFFGLALIANEARPGLGRPPNPALIFAGLGLMGIPVVQGTESAIAQSIRNAFTEEVPDGEPEKESSS